MSPLKVYIGYDPREQDAYDVCVHSLLRHSSIPLSIVKLDQRGLRLAGFYDRPFVMEGKQPVDMRDGKPFSTEFSFTRFLVPALNLYEGLAVFCDCDFLFTADIAAILPPAKNRAVHVVKHDQKPTEALKMDGMKQSSYARKNWSSMMVFQCDHPANADLTPWNVNHEPGSWLHGFAWLEDKDIGELPLTWNYLAGVSPIWESYTPPNAIHYTLGVPTMAGHENDQFAGLWTKEYNRLRQAGGESHLRVVA